MPNYSYHCEAGHEFDRYYRLDDYIPNPGCECGAPAHRVYRPPVVISAREVFYTSPVDGRPITTEAARAQDLARHDCVPYDPEMKRDYLRRQAEGDAALETAISNTAERLVTEMPSAKREKLHAELMGGAEAVAERQTAPVKPLKVKVHG